ncbi:Ribosomal RNA small subunit methyltransferase E [Jannaschia seosinensis]|uniref:Ribosomal RNA small subunit methyltransferase E n=1 Tax=Jannaschia seosinensis TaxID=313367 RepID=A0A0M7B7J7_9RHOB|nr:16S rRNA (uracil(1498)-N(3))-methyltransferase [Jannaschia seosinensis]CUH38337.1 Ribosomal RNA small subunit methyltransferase E [Jannaschia seosinensis]
MDSKVRLHVAAPVASGQAVELSREQVHYLSGVMRLSVGDTLTVFDGRSGAWRARIATLSKRSGELTCEEQVAPQRDPPDLWLLFAPIKKARTDFIVEKATELGSARILPVRTDHTNSERIRRDRLQAHAIEAAEQCGGTFVPEVDEIAPLSGLLDDWPEGRALIFCDEALSEDPTWREANGSRTSTAQRLPPAPAAILIGPEGGFSPEERERLRAHPATAAIALGPRILRADTAAVAALTLWQTAQGDWG